jgi:hypothetical protein
VLDAIEQAQSLTGVTLYVGCAPDTAHPFFKVLEGRYNARLLPQEGDDLGARMSGIMQKAFALGHQKVILTGTDLPNLHRGHFSQTANELGSHDLVMGPTLDGGYYLVALSRPAPEIFRGIVWSTATVLEETQRKAATLGLSVALLPSLRDLDEVEDLNAFIKVAGRDKSLSKRTAGALRLIGERLKERQHDF